MTAEHATHDTAHLASGHGQDAGHDAHGHGASDELGPVDIVMWSLGILGMALGLLIAICVAFAVGMLSV